MVWALARRYLVMAVAVPVAVAGVRKITEVVEARRGPSRGTRLLRKGADAVQGRFGRQKKRRRFF